MKHTPIVHDGSHTAIRLKRRVVRECQIGKKSESFSHRLELLGMQLHIYCAEDDGTITNVLHGTITRASKKGSRRYQFIPDRVEDLGQFNTSKLVRVR